MKVMGSSRATPMAADSPGRQPMTMPMAVPMAAKSRFVKLSALIKPWPIKDNVSSIRTVPPYFNSKPIGSFTPKNRVNVPYIIPIITRVEAAICHFGTCRNKRQPTISRTVEM